MNGLITLDNENELYHFGTPRHSDRYPWGSGERPYQGDNLSDKQKAKISAKYDKYQRKADEEYKKYGDKFVKKLKKKTDKIGPVSKEDKDYFIELMEPVLKENMINFYVGNPNYLKAQKLVNKYGMLEWDEAAFADNEFLVGLMRDLDNVK